ncbi:uncharacterized protein LOC134186966 isoform X2 [Corticium candelabrum]|uniref:uncharacterized protein LOC134186966 isoform X2 n=1 Tax=Corticium candelabrum TaxID=121492 RepID=UPI002E254180|nr:uncharacterized protein LOC134186966 isoform X2 [Corticium candelabrum]
MQKHRVTNKMLQISVIKTYARSGHLVVHRESLFVAYCVCGETFAPITWTGNAVDNGRGSNQDVTFGRSKYRLSNVSKRDEGRLCCVQGEHSVCLYLLVVDAPVVTLSDRTHVTCNNETLGKDTNAVSIQCNVSSHVEQDLAQGFMQVYINDVGTVSYDQTPSNGTRKDLAGNNVYTKAFEFREDMRNGDSLDCRWIREDGKIVKSNVQLVAKDHTCSVPTVSFTTIAASTVGSTNSTTVAMTSQNDGLIIGLTVPLTASVIVLLLIACYYRKEIGNKFRKRWPQPMNDLQRTNQNGVYKNRREEESTTVDLGLSDDDEGLEGSKNHANTQTSSHLPPSDSPSLVRNCLNSISETETRSRPTSEILNKTENNGNPRRNSSIDDLADRMDFEKSVISQLKTISQQFEEHQRMADDLLERVTPAAPKKRIQTAAYSMTNHDSMSREIDRGHSESCKIIRMTAV